MSDSKSGGLGTVAVTQVVFVVNKLTDAGDIAGWSWWWVLSPIWMSFALVVLFGAINGVIDAVQDAKIRKARAKRLRRL
jgi:hypothetical protein